MTGQPNPNYPFLLQNDPATAWPGNKGNLPSGFPWNNWESKYSPPFLHDFILTSCKYITNKISYQPWPEQLGSTYFSGWVTPGPIDLSLLSQEQQPDWLTPDTLQLFDWTAGSPCSWFADMAIITWASLIVSVFPVFWHRFRLLKLQDPGAKSSMDHTRDAFQSTSSNTKTAMSFTDWGTSPALP